MAGQKGRVRVIRALMATPRDTAEEEAALKRAIENINRLTGREERYRIELVHWKTETYPAIGPDTQSVVNRQIGNYDILVVVFKQEFGTRTPRANSGTEEEYDRALQKYLRDTLSVRILVYFADPLVRLQSINPVALGQIKHFRRRLEKEGVLYATYQDIAEFERLVVVHLTSACGDFLTAIRPTLITAVGAAPSHEIITFPDWIAESRLVQPQSANYMDIDLSPYRRTSLCLHGKFQSQSAYFRFGFKLSGVRQPILGDGSIQTSDPNVVFHIGKNKDNETLFYTIYRHGRRFGKDHLLLNSLAPHNKIPVGFVISQDNVVAFKINDEVVFEDLLPSEARDRVALLTWADEHHCQIEFTEIVLEVGPERR